MMTAPQTQLDPGTLLWIGPTAHAEFADAYRYCRDQAGQIAVRRGLRAALLRPAGYVRLIVFVRATRQMPRRELWQQFSERYRAAATVALASSLCDGEGRTGTPWPADHAVRFSRWQEVLPTYLSPDNSHVGVSRRDEVSRCAEHSRPSSMLVITDRFEIAEPYLQWARGTAVTALWQRRFIPAMHRGLDTVLWDDSAAPAVSAALWQERLGRGEHRPGADTLVGGGSVGRTQHHLWLALQPSINEIHEALQGGMTRVLSKPVRMESIGALQRS
jgi:hypothetical protein